MPQWSRERDADAARYPDERRWARCPRAFAALLLRYDHHVVWIGGRRALLRTYEWSSLTPDEWPGELLFHVSFTYADGHPAAPAEVQRAVDALAFSTEDA